MSELESLRRRIDALDRKLVDLLASRFEIAGRIGAEKRREGLSVFDPNRERRVIEQVSSLAGDRFPAERLRAIFREIISASRAQETGETVLAHGEPGGLAHHAAHLRFGASAPIETTTRDEDLFARLGDGTCGQVVASLEGHSFEASLDRLDLFLHADARILAEFYVPARLGLFAPDGADPESAVFGTAGALAQAARWIGAQSPLREVRVVQSTGEAVRQARAARGMVVAHPSPEVLEDLAAVEAVIEDFPGSYRRFVVIARRQAPATGRDKTSLLLVIPNRAGALHRVTGVLAEEGLNLCWLEPKPTHLGPWDHLFVVDVEGHQEDPAVRRALDALRPAVDLLQVLGSYPRELRPDR